MWNGTPLSGPRDAAVPADDATWRYLGVRARALSSAWSGGANDTDSPPLSSFVTLIRRPGTSTPFDAVDPLGEWLRLSPAALAPWARDDGLDAAAWFAVAPGTTTEVTVAPSTALSVALRIGLDADGAPSLAVRTRRDDVGGAWLGLDVAPLVDGSSIALLVPSWPEGAAGSDPVAISAHLTSTPPRGFEGRRLVDEAQARLAQAPAPEPSPQVDAPVTPAPPAWASVDEALAAIDHPSTRRSALVWLGATTGARFTEDVALLAPVPMLRDLGAAVAVEPDLRERLAVRLEHATIATVAAAEPLDDAVYAVALQWAGAAAEELDVIEGLMDGMDELEELDALLVSENVYALDDASPATRMRALDWLDPRGAAPPDFPVFGDTTARRAALDAWEAAAQGDDASEDDA